MKVDEPLQYSQNPDEHISPVDQLLKSFPSSNEQSQQSKTGTLELVDIVSKVIPTDMQDAIDMTSAISDSADQVGNIVQSIIEGGLSGM